MERAEEAAQNGITEKYNSRRQAVKMVVNILINNKELFTVNTQHISYDDIYTRIEEETQLQPDEYYLTSNGKRLAANDVEIVHHNENRNINCILRQVGGKGGFGSMLRAIGAQIEKTTNREACRDLSGRRLRDINEEKRVRAWLDKQGEREREAEERKKRKIEKLLAVPKHDFKDEEYEEARAKLTEKVSDAFEEGLKQAEEAKLSAPQDNEAPSSSCTASGTKRKAQADSKDKDKKKIKGSLWIDDNLSGSDLDSDESDDESDTIKKAIKC